MPEATQSSVLGRCPTCGQLVTVPAEARAHEVACPTCRHQALAAAFDVAAPLPVIVMAPGEHGSNGVRAANGHNPSPLTPYEAAPDDARTHLLLDLPYEGEEEAWRDPKTIGVGDDARTHLLLDPNDVKDAEPSALALKLPRVPPPPAPVAAAADDPRTHLMVGPLSLKAEQKTPQARALARLSEIVPPALRLSVWLDEVLHGRWHWAVVGFALACGFIAPGLDHLAMASGSTMGFFTFLFALLGTAAFGLAKLNGLRSDDGQWDPRIALNRTRAAALLFVESFERYAQSPRYLQRVLIGEAFGAVGIAGLLWAGFIGFGRWIFSSHAPASSLPFVSGSFLLLGVGSVLYARSMGPKPAFSLQESGNSLSAAAQLIPIIDLAQPLSEALSQGTTTLHKTVVALSRWRPREWPDEAAYCAALERHLARQLPTCKIERERWVGRTRLDGVIDIVIDGMLVIAVKHGFYKAQADRAVAQVHGYARAWSGKPMLLAIFESPPEAIFKSPSTTSLMELHKDLAVVSVRMPTHW
jgi:hypothetical protein